MRNRGCRRLSQLDRSALPQYSPADSSRQCIISPLWIDGTGSDVCIGACPTTLEGKLSLAVEPPHEKEGVQGTVSMALGVAGIIYARRHGR